MHVELIVGKNSDKRRAMCYNLLKELYIKEVILKEQVNNDESVNNGNLCESEHRRTG